MEAGRGYKGWHWALGWRAGRESEPWPQRRVPDCVAPRVSASLPREEGEGRRGSTCANMKGLGQILRPGPDGVPGPPTAFRRGCSLNTT